MKVTSLASGSSGNSMLVQAGSTIILIDCGLPTKRIERSLAERGIEAQELSGIFITHEHIDHVQAAGVLSRRYRVPVIANQPTLDAAGLTGTKSRCIVMEPGRSRVYGDLDITSFPLSHDSAQAMGFLVSHKGRHACFVTDLGIVTSEVEEPIRVADLAVVEANHDVDRLMFGPYPSMLKRRILSDVGHISNDTAARLIAETLGSDPKWVWLAHLSQTNNSPSLALRTVTNYLKTNNLENVEVRVADRDRPSLVWDSEDAYYQASMPLLG